MSLLWNNIEKDIEDIHCRDLATGKQVRLRGVEE